MATKHLLGSDDFYPGNLVYATRGIAVKPININYNKRGFVILDVNDSLLILKKELTKENFKNYICYCINKSVTVTVFDYQGLHLL